MVDFSANLNPLGPPEPIRYLWPELWQNVESYPSPQADGVLAFYAERFGLEKDRVLAGNGATELLYLIPRVLDLKRVAVLRPSYADYERACLLAGAQIEPLDLDAETEFAAPDLDSFASLFAEKLDRVDAVFLGNPNNPTGTLWDPEMLRRLAGEYSKIWWVVDESFIQLTNDFPARSLAFSAEPMGDNVLVLHSLTKTYALAGLRLGAVIGAAPVIERLRGAKEPWSVNAVADRVARELIGCGDYEERSRRLIREQRRVLKKGLAPFPLFRSLPPSSNFVLAQLRYKSLDSMMRGLLKRGFCVRDCRNFQGLEDGYFRFAVRRPKENRALLNAITDWVDELSFEPPLES